MIYLAPADHRHLQALHLLRLLGNIDKHLTWTVDSVCLFSCFVTVFYISDHLTQAGQQSRLSSGCQGSPEQLFKFWQKAGTLIVMACHFYSDSAAAKEFHQALDNLEVYESHGMGPANAQITVKTEFWRHTWDARVSTSLDNFNSFNIINSW